MFPIERLSFFFGERRWDSEGAIKKKSHKDQLGTFFYLQVLEQVFIL